jgi:hypothetical protein
MFSPAALAEARQSDRYALAIQRRLGLPGIVVGNTALLAG